MSKDIDTFFPELEGDERTAADAWLREYLRVIVRIHREHLASPQTELSTALPLTDPGVLARSVRLPDEPPSEPLS